VLTQEFDFTFPHVLRPQRGALGDGHCEFTTSCIRFPFEAVAKARNFPGEHSTDPLVNKHSGIRRFGLKQSQAIRLARFVAGIRTPAVFQ
jgi:hypothetical protein